MQARIVNESSIRDLVASDVINRLKSDEDKAQQAVDLAQRNRTTAENDLRKFYRSTWNTTADNNNNSNKEEVDEQLNQLRTLIGQRSEELKQAQSRLATIQNARHQHEQETLLQQQQNNNNSQRRAGVYDDDNVGNLASLRNNLRHQQQQQHSNQQQLQELHARAAGNSLLTTAASLNNNNNNRHRRNLIAPSNMTVSQQVHHNNQNNINSNQNKSSSSLFDNTTAEDYVGGVLVPPATRVDAFHQNTDGAGAAASSLSSSSPTRVLATTRARMKKQSGKRRSRLDDLALSDEDEFNDDDDDDYDENRKNKKKSRTSKKQQQQQQRVKKEEHVDDVPRIIKKEEEGEESSSSCSSSSDDDDDDTDSLFPSDEDSLDEPLDERVAQVIQPSADDLVPIRIIDNADYFLPKYVWNALLGYQQEAMRWFCGLHQRRVGGILGDEMGLGKTPMLSAYLHCLRFSGKLTQGPALIVAPLTVLAQWRRELQKWTPNMEVKILHSMEMGGGGRGRGSTKQNKTKKNTTNNNRNVKVKKEEEDDDDDDVFDDEEFAGNENEFLLNGSSSSSSASSNNIQSLLRDQIANKPNVVGLTTYGTFARHVDHFSRCNFDFVALDEGHKISNPESMVTIAAKTIPTTNRYILSGSPIQNSLIEIWSLFDFCCPGLLGGASTFVSAFEDPIKASRNPQATPLQLATAVECARALRDQIAPFLLRRLKKDVNKMLPRKVEKAVLCPLSDKQLQSYVDILSSTEARTIEHQHYNTQQELAGLDRYGREKATGSLNLLGVNKKRSMRGQMHRAWQLLADLRSICNHVDIFNVRTKHREEKNNNNINNNGMMMMNTNNNNNNNNNDDMVMLRASIAQQQRREQPQQQEEAEEEVVERLNTSKGKRKNKTDADSNKNKSNSNTTSLSFRSNKPVDYSGSSKLTALMELLEQWKPDGHKVLVFCQTRMMLDIIENAVSQKMYRYMRMDGTTAGAGRHDLVHKFNHDQSIFVALLTTRVGGLGLNLTGADRVVLFDPDWNPVVDEQARERAWRIGQTREVHVYRLISSGTIEEHILHRQMAKMFVTEKVLSDPTLQRFFSIHSLVDAFRLGNEYADRVAEVCHGTIIANTISIKPSIKQELNTNHSQTMSIVDQHQHQHQQQNNGNNNNNDNNNNSNTKTTTTVSGGAKVVADEYAQQAPERLQMDSSQSAHRMGGEYYCHSQQSSNNNNNRQSQPSQRSSSSMMNHHLSQNSNNNNVNNNNNNYNNNNMMMMMMPQQQQQQEQQRSRVKMMMMDDGSSSNNNNTSASSATDPNSSTGLISSLVDGTKDEDGIMDKAASQTSIAAKRLAQLSALTTLKKALTNKNPDGTTFDDRIRLLPASNNNSNQNKNKNNNNNSHSINNNNNNTHRNNNSTSSSSSSVWRR